MKQGRIEKYDLNEKEIVFSFKSSEVKKAGIISLIFLILLPLSIPIITIVLWGDEIRFGFIVTLIIFWGTAIYFIRLTLWNLYGKEVFRINKLKCYYYQDYGFYKERKLEYEISNFEVAVMFETEGLTLNDIPASKLEENTQVTLRVNTGGDKYIDSHLTLTLSELTDLAMKVEADFIQL
jgi:hypothetical protein